MATSRWVRLHEYRGEPSPVRLIYPYGKYVPLEGHADMLKAVAEWLVSQGRISASDCPVSSPRARTDCLVNTEPLHPDGRTMRQYRQLSNGLYLHTSHSSYQTRNHCIWMLKRFGDDPSRFRVMTRASNTEIR